jgi:UDP-N-acetylmuramyl pentapeptide phosphotransferase/UDP-N-acetylglucosamine-1-phosphate transferase
MNRPYNAPGIGWMLAAIAGVVAVLAALNIITGISGLAYWLIVLLALAILL